MYTRYAHAHTLPWGSAWQWVAGTAPGFIPAEPLMMCACPLREHRLDSTMTLMLCSRLCTWWVGLAALIDICISLILILQYVSLDQEGQATCQQHDTFCSSAKKKSLLGKISSDLQLVTWWFMSFSGGRHGPSFYRRPRFPPACLAISWMVSREVPCIFYTLWGKSVSSSYFCPLKLHLLEAFHPTAHFATHPFTGWGRNSVSFFPNTGKLNHWRAVSEISIETTPHPNKPSGLETCLSNHSLFSSLLTLLTLSSY